MKNDWQPDTQNFVHALLENDAFCKWLGIEIIDVAAGYAKIAMRVRADMLNGIGLLHGGVLFSLADSSFGFACNSHQRKAVSLQASINYFKTAAVGETIMAEAHELHYGKSTGVYEVKITNGQQQLLAVYRGTCFIRDKSVSG